MYVTICVPVPASGGKKLLVADNTPLPENIPEPENTPNNSLPFKVSFWFEIL